MKRSINIVIINFIIQKIHLNNVEFSFRLKQVEEQKENLQQALHEMSKPLARYANDDDLEQHLREQEREGDPMLAYIRSKKTDDSTKSKYILFSL